MTVNQEIPKSSIALNDIVFISNDETSSVLTNEGNEQKRYSLNEALESAPGMFIRKMNKTSAVFETHGHCERATLHSGLSDIIRQPDSESQNVLVGCIIATPICDGEQIYVLRLNPCKGLNAFITSLLQPEDIALRINNPSLTRPDEASQALSLLLTQQSTQFIIRRSGAPRLINVSITELTGMNGQRSEETQ